MSHHSTGTGGGLYTVDVPREPITPRKRGRARVTIWNGRVLDPSEQAIIAEGLAQARAREADIVKGVTT